MERYRTTIILVVLLIVLGGVAVLLSNKGGANGSASTTPTALPLANVWTSTDPVVVIDVISSTGTVSVRKDVTTTIWTLTAPVKEMADPFALGSEADVLQNLQATSSITNSTDLAQFGLGKNPLKVTVTFSDTAQTKRTLLVGTATFDGSGYYVKTDNSPSVYVVVNTTIEPLRTWLTTPPVSPPTPTPALPTPAPTSELTGTVTTTVGTAGGTLTVPPAVTSLPITSTTEITSSVPGAANAGTPPPMTATVSATATP